MRPLLVFPFANAHPLWSWFRQARHVPCIVVAHQAGCGRARGKEFDALTWVGANANGVPRVYEMINAKAVNGGECCLKRRQVAMRVGNYCQSHCASPQ
jgi:hypothetical protein